MRFVWIRWNLVRWGSRVRRIDSPGLRGSASGFAVPCGLCASLVLFRLLLEEWPGLIVLNRLENSPNQRATPRQGAPSSDSRLHRVSGGRFNNKHTRQAGWAGPIPDQFSVLVLFRTDHVCEQGRLPVPGSAGRSPSEAVPKHREALLRGLRSARRRIGGARPDRRGSCL